MDSKTFTKRVWEHLESYKINVLGVSGKVTIGENSYGHILPPEHAKLNLGIDESKYELNDLVLKFKEIDCKTIKLHKDWQHLNSSQVLCISYFYDFFADKAKLQSLISDVLGIDAKVKNPEFERVVKDRTNVDFVVYLENGGTVYFEIKYTEQEFGQASDDDKYRRIKEKHHSEVDISYEDYIKQYQLVRNICLSPKNSNNCTVFLLPKANESINEKYEDGIKTIGNLCDFNVKRLYWEDLIEQIPNKNVHEKYFAL